MMYFPNDEFIFSKKKDYLRCEICPNQCVLNSGKKGKCGVISNLSNIKIINDLNGFFSVVSFEPIEKKPFKHFMEGSLTLSLGMSFCNLSCAFCENHDISQIKPEKLKFLDYCDIFELMQKRGCNILCFSFNEPMLYIEYIYSVYENLKKYISDLKIILKTNAYCNKEIWKWSLDNFIKAVNIDWKGSSEEFKKVTGSNFYVIEDRIFEANDSNSHVEISIPIYYQDINILDKEMNYFGKFLSGINKNIPCHLLKVFPSYKMNDVKATDDSFINFSLDILSSYGIKFIYI